ncbi:septal ring lytic transglycosylase RlpA family protein [Methyloligella sp. 2.7D]|uniref:septal ring lytic transglycosylase RlpA family protein n=1 Tax=unclassified Methyloligella TaxID=2625955 RepID=UPI00157D45B3|nr:septal ring lytic transglycosylase RlpA family protein [Methyloligella sp. GL2]QKP77445.1 septal ring lytic transglycosylase RlpA family protein [Methyloligella sp. GL2]
MNRVGLPSAMPGKSHMLQSPAGIADGFRYLIVIALVFCLTVWLGACGKGNGEKLGERIVPLGQTAPKGGGRRLVGEPYKVAGRWYTPKEVRSYSKVGVASWYGDLFHGRRTANGEIYDVNRLSAAHKTLPLPAYARVTNLSNNRTIVVRVNDRGPFSNDRLIDLSKKAADALGFRQHGVAKVRVTYMGPAPLSGDDSYERRFLASQSWVRHYASAEPPPNADPITVASVSKPVPAPLPKPAALGPLPSEPAPAGGAFSIQAGSFSQEGNAAKARQTLGGIGHVDVAPVMVGDVRYYRVRVGPFADRGRAEAALQQITAAGYHGARVVSQ